MADREAQDLADTVAVEEGSDVALICEERPTGWAHDQDDVADVHESYLLDEQDGYSVELKSSVFYRGVED